MSDTEVASKARHVLEARFPGRCFVVFYREGDGPDRDISAAISSFNKEAFLPPFGSSTGGDDYKQKEYGNNLMAGNHGCTNDAVDVSTAAAGSAEFLRIEVGGSGHGMGANGRAVEVSLWAVGRVSLQVEARSFDEALGDDCQAAAEAAFTASWALRIQVKYGDRTGGTYMLAAFAVLQLVLSLWQLIWTVSTVRATCLVSWTLEMTAK